MILNNSKTLVEGEAWADHDCSDEEEEDYVRKRRRIDEAQSLPGVQHGENAAHKAYSKNTFHSAGCDFSGDGKSFAVATSHGVFQYELDLGFVSTENSVLSSFGTALERFQPTILSKNVSIPAIIKAVVEEKNVTKGFILALALNDARILTYLFEHLIPSSKVPEVVMSIGSSLLPALLHFLSCMLHPSFGSRSIGLCNNWLQAVLEIHTSTLLAWTSGQRPSDMSRSNGKDGDKNSGKSGNQEDNLLTSSVVNVGEVQATLLRCLQRLSQHQDQLKKVFEKNAYSLEYLCTRVEEPEGGRKNQKKGKKAAADEESDDEKAVVGGKQVEI